MTTVLVREYRATALQGYRFYCTACFFCWPWSSVLTRMAHGHRKVGERRMEEGGMEDTLLDDYGLKS